MVRVRIRFRIRFSAWLVSCYAHVHSRLKVVIVTERICEENKGFQQVVCVHFCLNFENRSKLRRKCNKILS